MTNHRIFDLWPAAVGGTNRLKSGPVLQMLVFPTQPRGGSVMFSFSNSSCRDCATTATASAMCADSFLPLISWRPSRPVPTHTHTQQEVKQAADSKLPSFTHTCSLNTRTHFHSADVITQCISVIQTHTRGFRRQVSVHHDQTACWEFTLTITAFVSAEKPHWDVMKSVWCFPSAQTHHAA